MPAWISPNLFSLLVFIALAGPTGVLSRVPKSGLPTLSKPDWPPPNWLFPPAWAALYLMIAVAGWLVWTTPHESLTLILGLWAGQMMLNAAWSYIFFRRHEIALGLIDILALWATIAGFAVAAWPVNQWASLLFIPYLLWVTFAAALNAPIWLRTPAAA